MNKLEEGMYVRTKLGIIAKCTNILEDCSYDFDRIVYQDTYNEDGFMEIPYLLIDKYIIKSSFNIIDLIEEGDIIQWETIEPYRDGGINEVISRFGEGLGIYQIEADRLLSLKDMTIKSIVTKEQFESMKYEVSNE